MKSPLWVIFYVLSKGFSYRFFGCPSFGCPSFGWRFLFSAITSCRMTCYGLQLVYFKHRLLSPYSLRSCVTQLGREHFAAMTWIVAALYILRLLNPNIAFLDGIGVSFGEGRLSVYGMFKRTLLLVPLIWIATQFSKLINARLQQSRSLNHSMRSLNSQLIRLGTLFFASVIALNAIGVDLTALAVFLVLCHFFECRNFKLSIKTRV